MSRKCRTPLRHALLVTNTTRTIVNRTIFSELLFENLDEFWKFNASMLPNENQSKMILAIDLSFVPFQMLHNKEEYKAYLSLC